MSVLIKGMKMPKAGNWKTIRIYYDGTCAEPNWQGDCNLLKGCEAVPIPNNGDLIDEQPTINPVKHGKWEKISDRNYKCSCCNAWWSVDRDSTIRDFKYCPDCGARMDGE